MTARNQNNSSNRGFASPNYSEEKQREAASKGGREAHKKGTAHEFTSEEAREAGRKGGKISSGNFANDREKASRAGQNGGSQSSRGNEQ